MHILLALSLTLATPPADGIEPLPEETVVVPSAGHAEQVSRIRKDFDRWIGGLKAGPQFLAFAEVGDPESSEPGRILDVRDPKAWPDGTNTSYQLVLDGERRVRLLLESPQSQSGDWRLDLIQLYDEAGRVVLFRRISRFFNSGCAEILQETSTAFFGPDGRLLARDYQLDAGGKKVSPQDCTFEYRQSYRIARNVRSALEQVRLLPAATKAGVRIGSLEPGR